MNAASALAVACGLLIALGAAGPHPEEQASAPAQSPAQSSSEPLAWQAAVGPFARSNVQGRSVMSLATRKGRAYASMADGTLWTSEDSGLTWSRIDTTFTGIRPQFGWPYHFGQLFIIDDMQLRAGADREFLASGDGGRTWSVAGLSTGVTALVRLRDAWYAATWTGVFRSADLARWTECSRGLPPVGVVRSLITTPEGDLIAIQDHAAYRSQDDCRSWWPLSSSIPPLGSGSYQTPLHAFSDSTIGIVVWGDGLAQWSATDGKWMVRMKTPFTNAFVRDERGRYWLGTGTGVSRLSIEGAEWRLVAAGLDGPIEALAIDPSGSGYLIAAIKDRGVFRAPIP
jgi:hypothetical protein